MGTATLRARARRRGPHPGLAAALAVLAAFAGYAAVSLIAALACAGFATDAHGQPATVPSGAAAPGGAAAPAGTKAPAGAAVTGGAASGGATGPATGARAGDGARIAAQGAPNGAAACAGCHGERGEGRAGAGMPRLAGQPAGYLAAQLAAYADGRRPNPVMTPIAKALDTAQREAVAAHYAALPVDTRGPRTAPGSAATGRAATLARVGDARIGVQACANCHGPDGSGVAPDLPALAGQHEDYLLATLRAWRDGERRTDPSGQMPAIAKRLREPDLQALARHFAAMPPGLPREAGGDALAASAAPVDARDGLRPVPGEAATRATASGAEARSARRDVPSGPRRAASDPPAGTPGAPAAGGTAPEPDALRGGSQGIGGGGASGSGASGNGAGEAR